MKPNYRFVDVEKLVIDVLAEALEGEELTVGLKLPSDWGRDSIPHVMVALDGTPTERWPMAAFPTVRIVAWVAPSGAQAEGSPSAAKDLALRCEGILGAHPGGSGLTSCRPQTGLLSSTDPDHSSAALASVTVRAAVRSIPNV